MGIPDREKAEIMGMYWGPERHEAAEEMEHAIAQPRPMVRLCTQCGKVSPWAGICTQCRDEYAENEGLDDYEPRVSREIDGIAWCD